MFDRSHGIEVELEVPGEADIVVRVSARHFDSAVELTAQESRFPIHDQIEWRP